MNKLLLLLLLANPIFARAVYTNWCQQGNQTILVSGIMSSSTTPVQRSYPTCTVTVYQSDGMTLATIYSDNMGTTKANPFTLSGTQGLYSFYADQAFYVIKHAATGLTTFSFNIFVPLDGSAGGFISSLNGLTAATQTFAVGTAGSDFAIVSSGSTHTFNLPTASASVRGALSAADWSTFNGKAPALTFTVPLVNTSNVVAITLPITVAQGGCGQITKTPCFDALSPLTTAGDMLFHNGTNNVRLAIGTLGQCLTTTDGVTPSWGTVCPTVPVGVNQGGLGITTLTGIPYGAGTSPVQQVATTTPLQALRLKPNVSTTTYEFSTPPAIVSTDFNFPAQAPGGTLTATVGASAILTPCPLGLNGADPTHYVYISGGTGTAEAVLLTGGSCTSGASTGTVTFTPANNHSGGWTITSATSGVQEAVCGSTAANPEVTVRGAITLNANVSFCGKTSVQLTLSNGVTLAGSGALPAVAASRTNISDQRSGLGFSQNVGANITSATTIAPVAGISHVTGTTATDTITPPAGFATGCIVLIADAAWPVHTGGNIARAFTGVAATSYIFCYDGTAWTPN